MEARIQHFLDTSDEADDMTLLMVAARDGNEEDVRTLLRYNCNVHKKDKEGYNALMFACCEIATENANVVRLLLEAGADLRAKTLKNSESDEEGMTAFLLACKYGHAAIVDCILQWVIAKGDPSLPLADLLDQRDVDEHTPLHIAARAYYSTNNPLETVKLLLKYGAPLDVFNTYDATPLIATVDEDSHEYYGRTAVIRVLIDAIVATNKDVLNYRESSGRTALWCAAAEQSSEVVKMLLDAGADTSIADDDGLTPLDLAMKRKDEPQMFKLFL